MLANICTNVSTSIQEYAHVLRPIRKPGYIAVHVHVHVHMWSWSPARSYVSYEMSHGCRPILCFEKPDGTQLAAMGESRSNMLLESGCYLLGCDG